LLVSRWKSFLWLTDLLAFSTVETKGDSGAGEFRFSIFSNVLKKEIAECHALNAIFPGLFDKLLHRCFILSITAWTRKIDDLQWKTDSLGLTFQEFQSHCMNRDALIELIHRRNQPGNS